MAIDLSSSRGLALKIDSGLAYEALLGLGMVHGEMADLRYTEGAALQARFKALPATLRKAHRSVDSGLGFNWFDLIGLVGEAAPPRGLPEFVRLLAAMEPVDLKLAMLGFHKLEFRRSVGESVFRAAAGGDRAAAEKFREAGLREGRGGGGSLLGLAPELVQRRTIAILAALPEDYYLIDPASGRLLAESAEQARTMAAALKPGQVLERLTRGIVYTGEPGVDEILLVPTLIHRPWTMIIDHQRVKIFCYPVPPGRGPGDIPDAELVALFRALGDETRLRLLRRLAAGTASFAQLARDLGLAKSTVHHHALQLRTAGLLRLDLASGGLELVDELPGMDRPLRDYLAKHREEPVVRNESRFPAD